MLLYKPGNDPFTFVTPTARTSTDRLPCTTSTDAFEIGPVQRCCSISLAWSFPNSISTINNYIIRSKNRKKDWATRKEHLRRELTSRINYLNTCNSIQVKFHVFQNVIWVFFQWNTRKHAKNVTNITRLEPTRSDKQTCT